MKIAIPTSNGQLAEHFGHCRQFTFFDIEHEQIRGITFKDAPPHKPGLLPSWLAENGTTDIIAGGIGQKAIHLFNLLGINVLAGASMMTPEEIITGYLEKTIAFSSNYCDHKEHNCK